MKRFKTAVALVAAVVLLPAAPALAGHRPATITVDGRQTERLDRGLVAVPTPDGVLVSWRLLADDRRHAAFDVFRNGRKIFSEMRGRSNFLDVRGKPGDRYSVALRGGVRSRPVTAWDTDHLDIPLQKPGDTYRANDASIGDLDGDGQYEIVLKWDPDNSKDNSQSGVTGEVFLDAYELDGTRLWRIGLGRNIRAGAHYTQFLVYDFDGDGRAEVVSKTADGTTDGTGTVIGDATADHRNTAGYVLTGPEFLTVFNGRTGAATTTIPYEPARGDVCAWGDCYGNRVDRFLASVAYLDGKHPSIVMARGYYTRTVLVAYDFAGGALTHRWTFDSNVAGKQYEGQGYHNLSPADVDGDGRDEIVYGALTIDDDGSVLHSTGLGHGDALHVGDLDPNRPGLEVFGVHESKSAAYGMETHDAATGTVLHGQFTGIDTGRGASGDIDPAYPGEETWAVGGAWNSPTGWLYSTDGTLISTDIPAANFVLYWDGDLGREILDHDWDADAGVGTGTIGKWDPATRTTTRLLTATGTSSNNYTKGTPSLQADLLGDWREEVLWRTDDSTALRLYSTPFPSRYGFTTLVQDKLYRLGVAWQNVAYNQPPHVSYYLGNR
ncbi:rhamnogalacturonan lyase [Actinoplanes couchii]|uniref:Rhamnogalacturonan endolyase YesW n=1 Tax=Actinoplanes couchii TaxID=403638 RepID=A0ABQ3X803_9ACTN|nr:rhamnogalacturonan lyase [Actinoplanes couchii]MDR6320359.1 rhamnogalacturonan endolyase [Actinoplanes couchii]GID54628.1 rhamnogalacturonan endolyase YesW [Actinoplanes couchii]